jgi:hypothetical protein
MRMNGSKWCRHLPTDTTPRITLLYCHLREVETATGPASQMLCSGFFARTLRILRYDAWKALLSV